MNLIEAIKSGRRFKLGDRDYHDILQVYQLHYARVDLISDDWELEPIPEKSITITKMDLDEAWCETFGAYHEAFPTGRIVITGDFQKLCKELGLD